MFYPPIDLIQIDWQFSTIEFVVHAGRGLGLVSWFEFSGLEAAFDLLVEETAWGFICGQGDVGTGLDAVIAIERAVPEIDE